eukprot:g20280.t1
MQAIRFRKKYLHQAAVVPPVDPAADTTRATLAAGKVMVMVDGVAEIPGLELPAVPSRHDFKQEQTTKNHPTRPSEAPRAPEPRVLGRWISEMISSVDGDLLDSEELCATLGGEVKTAPVKSGKTLGTGGPKGGGGPREAVFGGRR